jgi:hypothetical protein
MMHLCGECHRSPTDPLASRPEQIPNLARFAGTALAASKCYQRSGGQLSCVTCHDPHNNGLRAGDQACQGCHTGKPGRWKVCPVNQQSGCVSCHMPLQPVDLPVDRKFRMHWIKTYPEHERTASGSPAGAQAFQPASVTATQQAGKPAPPGDSLRLLP